MLEYCPEEMSKQQLQNWAENQKYQTSHLEGNNMNTYTEELLILEDLDILDWLDENDYQLELEEE